MEGETKRYAGAATITKLAGRACYLVNYSAGGASSWGFAVRKGDFLAVNWKITTPGAVQIPGVTLYEVKGRDLDGIWLTPGNEDVNTEKLIYLGEIGDKGT